MDFFQRLVCYFVSAVLVSLGVSSAFDDDRIRWLLVYTGYFFVLLLFVAWTVSLIRVLRLEEISVRQLLKTNVFALVASAVLSVAVFISVSPQLRVLSDETNLISVSQSMHLDRTAFNTTMSKWTFGDLHLIERSPPTRPLVFPFLISLLHSIFGFHYKNVFVLNFLLLFGFLTGLIALFRRRLNYLQSTGAVLLVLSSPILSLSVTSGGFDFCALVFFCFSFFSLYLFLKKETPERLALMWSSFLVLSQTRYESVICAVVVLAGLLFTRKMRWKSLERWLPLTLLALIPIFWQRKIMIDEFENPPGEPAFGIWHFAKHLSTFFQSHLDFRMHLPFPTLAMMLSLFLIVLGLIRWSRGSSMGLETYQKLFFGLLAASISILMVVYLSHHAGEMNHPTQSRLFLLYVFGLSLIPILWSAQFSKSWIAGALPWVGVISFLIYHPVASRNTFMNAVNLPRETKSVLSFLDQRDPKKFLLIASPPGVFSGLGYGAINFKYFAQNKAQILDQYERHLFEDIFVVQKVGYADRTPQVDYVFDAESKLKPLYESAADAGTFLRISRIELR